MDAGNRSKIADLRDLGFADHLVPFAGSSSIYLSP